MNSLYQQLQQNSARQIAQRIKSMPVQKLLNENPQARALIQAANGNPKKAFYDLANKMNVNPDEVLNMLRY